MIHENTEKGASAMDELKYGLLDNKLIHIEDAKKGLACNCLCPHCRGQLIAKKGQKRTKHFAHYRLADCNHGTETALHMMAKDIIAQSKSVFVPYFPKSEYDFSRNGKVITFENAVTERQFSNSLRGDIVLYSGERFLNVEIKVTHGVDVNKAISVFNLGIPTIEIDLSDIKTNFTANIVTEYILSGEQTQLIYSPRCKEIFAKRILGEWKNTISNSNGTHVKDCPLSRKNAYFIDYCRKGGKYECHNCNAHYEYMKIHSVFDEAIFLCYGCVDSVDFSKIDKIIHLEKEEKHIRHVELLMQDGSTFKI